MSKYCDRRINTGSDRINEGQLLFQLKNDLLEIIDNKMAVEAYVEAVKIYSRDRAKEASYSFEV